MMPAMAAAFAVLRPDEIHDASPQLNVIQRVGGSMGTAILAVILSRNILDASAPSGGKPPTRAALARAFGNTFWWALGITAAAAVPAAFLMVSERQTRRRGGQTGQTPRFATDEDGIPIPLFGLGRADKRGPAEARTT